MIQATELLAWLEQQIERAEKEYAIHTGNQPACQLHKDGRVTGGLKYDEGRLVAFTTLRRIVRKSGDGAAGELLVPIETEQARWLAALYTYQHAPQPAITWIAYNQGGVDAISATLAHLERLA